MKLLNSTNLFCLMTKIELKKIICLCIFLAFSLIILNILLTIKAKGFKSAYNQFRLGIITKTAKLNHIEEKITYDVKLGKIYLGKMQFSNISNVEMDGRLLNAMLVETRLTQFTDKERIYIDPQTLLPIKVERDISNWFIKERIIEDYDQDNFTVTIIKSSGLNQKKTVIKKDGHIHNALFLPFFVRHIPKPNVGRIIIANLPVRRLELKLVSIEEIKVPAGTFRAYHFTSSPRQIDIWITADERRIPIKIQGNSVFGYSILMKEYTQG